MTEGPKGMSLSGAVIAELAALYEISSLTPADTEEAFIQDAVSCCTRLFGVRYLALIRGKGLQRRLSASWGFRDLREVWERMSLGTANQFRMPIGDAASAHELFMEHSEPLRERERRLYTIFAKRLENGLLTVHSIQERRRAEQALRQSRQALEGIIGSSPAGIIALDAGNLVTEWNPAAERMFGWTRAEILGRPYPAVPDALRPGFKQITDSVFRGERIESLESLHLRKDGSEFPAVASMAPVFDAERRVVAMVVLLSDVTEQRQLEMQLAHAQKLESVGHLAAGIAHEINTPTQYVGDNLRFMKGAFEGLAEVLAGSRDLLRAAHEGAVPPELIARVEQAAQKADLDFMMEEVPSALAQSLEGVERVTKIVRAMKDFSHPDSGQKTPADLNQGIESTVTVARNEWKYTADVRMDLDPELPHVPCLLGEFNQVVLNLVINAAHAIQDRLGKNSQAKGTIGVSTRRAGQWAEVRISDSGTGIPEAIRSKIFDPFFTTKGVGRGTGQGLGIAHQVIVKRHGGTIDFETEMGLGTTFILRLPLREPAAPGAEAA